MTTSDVLQTAIKNAADILANQIKDNLDKGAYPTGNDEFRPNYKPIQDTLVIGTPKEEEGKISIDITLGGKDAPYAPAYEFGSGERATFGETNDYQIKAKNAPVLAFLWHYPSPLGRKFIKPQDENVAFSEIEHPGIEAKPYLKPAIETKRDEMTKIIGQEFKAFILSGVNKVEVIK